MVDRLALARAYAQEQVQARGDIIGAFVVGSVARGDATEASDIDLGLVLAGGAGQEAQRAGVDTWREGVYIDAMLVPEEWYGSLEKVMPNPYAATHMHDALILYDPAGLLTRVQQQVRAVFMEPAWLALRLQSHMETLRGAASGLREAVAAGDWLALCESVVWMLNSLVSVPLIRSGVTPSSTRALKQLEHVSAALRERICEWQGSAGVGADDVRALLPFSSEASALVRGPSWGHMPEYFARKTVYLLDSGLHREALSLIWGAMGLMSLEARQSADPELRSKADALAERWLRAVGWEGQAALQGKLRVEEALLAEMEAFAADLPSGTAAEGEPCPAQAA